MAADWYLVVGTIIGIIFGMILSRLINQSSFVDKLFNKRSLSLSLSTEIMKKRMASVTVCTVSDYSGYSFNAQSAVEDRCVEFMFFGESDAVDYSRVYPGGYDLRILRLPLAHILSIEEEFGSPLRLVPELPQVRNALEIQEKGKDIVDVPFSGVPIFQADGLNLLMGQDNDLEFRPLFLRKEDLEMSLEAKYEELTKPYDIQVFALEDIIQSMRDSSTSEWNDVFFVAPGLTLMAWTRRMDRLNS